MNCVKYLTRPVGTMPRLEQHFLFLKQPDQRPAWDERYDGSWSKMLDELVFVTDTASLTTRDKGISGQIKAIRYNYGKIDWYYYSLADCHKTLHLVYMADGRQLIRSSHQLGLCKVTPAMGL
jgi:hypothetical protein